MHRFLVGFEQWFPMLVFPMCNFPSVCSLGGVQKAVFLLFAVLIKLIKRYRYCFRDTS